jgi:hypothetical protein
MVFCQVTVCQSESVSSKELIQLNPGRLRVSWYDKKPFPELFSPGKTSDQGRSGVCVPVLGSSAALPGNLCQCVSWVHWQVTRLITAL